MVVALLASRADPASVNLRDAALALRAWRDTTARVDGLPVRRAGDLALVETPRLHLACDGLDREIAAALGENVEAILVLSKHKAASGASALTVHPIGNFGEAEFGGRPRALVPAAGALATRVLREASRAARASGLAHEVTWEATHHGPFFETPTAFVEIGTTEASWTDPQLGQLLARAVLDAAEAGPALAAPDERVLVALGGSHYAPRARDAALRRRCAIGHIVPTYQLEAGVAPSLVAEAARLTPGATGFLVDARLDATLAAPFVRALEASGLARVDAESLPRR